MIGWCGRTTNGCLQRGDRLVKDRGTAQTRTTATIFVIYEEMPGSMAAGWWRDGHRQPLVPGSCFFR